MKRFLPCIVSLVLIAMTLLSGCSASEVDRSEELKEAFKTAYSNLSRSFEEDTCDYTLISEFLESWATSSGVKIETSSEHYTVLLNPASEGNSDQNTTVLQCAIHTDSVRSDLKTLSMGLASLLGPREHENIRLIVTEINQGQYIGAAEVDPKYLDCTDFINLSDSGDYSLFVSGCETSRATIKTNAGREAPEYTNAFEITMGFNKYADPYNFDKKNNYPDPINTIGNLLATSKSAGRLFEIASFESKSCDGYLPYSVSAVVVIDSNNVDAFKSKFDKSYNTIENKFDDIESDFVYTMNETRVPSSVLSDASSNRLISLMYTLSTGIYSQDEETGLINSASYLQSISTDKNIEVSVDMRARSSAELTALSTDYETIAGLCNMEYATTEEHPVWTSSDDNALAGFFSNLVPLAEGDSNIMLTKSELDLFAQKNKKLNAISYSFVKDASKNTLKNIVNYMDKSRSDN